MLKDIFSRCKGWLCFAYAFLAVEFTIFAFMPYVLGKAIDALIERDRSVLWIYVAVMSVGLAISYARRRIDSRIFMNIWRQKAVESIRDLIDRNVEPAKIIVRASNIRQCANFFECFIPSAVSAVMSIIVGGAMCCSALAWWASGTVLGLAAFSLSVSYFFSKRNGRIESECQAMQEERETRIVNKDYSQIDDCYGCLKKLYVKQSDLEACGWGIVDLCIIIAEVVTVISLVGAGSTPGTIMATLAYVYKVIGNAGFFVHFFNQAQQINVITEFLAKD